MIKIKKNLFKKGYNVSTNGKKVKNQKTKKIHTFRTKKSAEEYEAYLKRKKKRLGRY